MRFLTASRIHLDMLLLFIFNFCVFGCVHVLYVYVVCMCMLWEGIHALVHTCGGQRRTLNIFQHSPPYCMETGSLAEPEAPHFGWVGQPVSSQVYVTVSLNAMVTGTHGHT